MALQFHPNIKPLAVTNGLINSGLNTNSCITIFPGTQPTCIDIEDNWSTIKNTFLIHYTGISWIHPLDGAVNFCSIKTPIPTAVANKTGVGTWAIIWCNNPSIITETNILAGTKHGKYMVVPISIKTENGIIKFESVDFIAGENKDIYDGVISVS